MNHSVVIFSVSGLGLQYLLMDSNPLISFVVFNLIIFHNMLVFLKLSDILSI